MTLHDAHAIFDPNRFDPERLQLQALPDLEALLQSHRRGYGILTRACPWLAVKFADEIQALEAEINRRTNTHASIADQLVP